MSAAEFDSIRLSELADTLQDTQNKNAILIHKAMTKAPQAVIDVVKFIMANGYTSRKEMVRGLLARLDEAKGNKKLIPQVASLLKRDDKYFNLGDIPVEMLNEVILEIGIVLGTFDKGSDEFKPMTVGEKALLGILSVADLRRRFAQVGFSAAFRAVIADSRSDRTHDHL